MKIKNKHGTLSFNFKMVIVVMGSITLAVTGGIMAVMGWSAWMYIYIASIPFMMFGMVIATMTSYMDELI